MYVSFGRKGVIPRSLYPRRMTVCLHDVKIRYNSIIVTSTNETTKNFHPFRWDEIHCDDSARCQSLELIG